MLAKAINSLSVVNVGKLAVHAKVISHLQLCNVTLSWFPDGISFSSFLCANYHILDIVNFTSL